MSDNVNPNPENCRILLVEDDTRLAALIKEYLEQQGISVVVEHRGDRAVKRILNLQPDLVVLDLMLPGMDGLEVCKAVRADFSGPILMLTARDEDIDEVVGLEIGADDYVTKPVQPRVLLARIRALLRRSNHSHHNHTTENTTNTALTFGTLHISPTSREVSLCGEAVDLTSHEFELLWLFASRAGEILSRDTILAALRGIGYDGVDRSVDVKVSRLRKKLADDAGRPFRIKTVRGKGYLFIAGAWE